MVDTIRIYSIFQSIDGEVNIRGIGSISTFIRFSGCTAKCAYCDTQYAKSPTSGKDMTIKEIIDDVQKLRCNNVTITGGEPLEQKGKLEKLLETLLYYGFNVSVETNGFHSFSKTQFPYSDVSWVVDIKKEGLTLLREFIEMNLDRRDFIKQVVGTYSDFQTAINRKQFLQSSGVKARFAFSPEFGAITPNKLLSYIMQAKVTDVVLNVQLHKLLDLCEPN